MTFFVGMVLALIFIMAFILISVELAVWAWLFVKVKFLPETFNPVTLLTTWYKKIRGL